jgi:hypothetical protein
VISLEAGPPGIPIAVLTDEGISSLRLDMHPAAVEGAAPDGPPPGPGLVLTPLITDRPVLAGSKSLIPRLDMIRDLDGDGTWDLLLPARDGAAVYVTATERSGRTPSRASSSRATRRARERARSAPTRARSSATWTATARWTCSCSTAERRTGGPRSRSCAAREAGASARRRRSRSTSSTRRPRVPSRPLRRRASPGRARTETADLDGDGGFRYFGDLTGDGLAEAVFVSEIDSDKGELKQAKEPEFEYRFHHADKNLVIQPQPYQKVHVTGFGFSIDEGDMRFEEFLDLDGDGRKDLVTVTLDFSLFQSCAS